MLLTDEFDNPNCTKLSIIAGIYKIDFVYILVNYAWERTEERRRLSISRSFLDACHKPNTYTVLYVINFEF